MSDDTIYEISDILSSPNKMSAKVDGDKKYKTSTPVKKYPLMTMVHLYASTEDREAI